MRSATFRSDLSVRDIPAPQGLAPFSLALAADIRPDDHGDSPYGTGRLVLLHDPAGQDGWAGDTRLVTIVSAPVEPEMAGDPLLAEVAWGWLADALVGRGAALHAAGGTVTRTASTSFGDLAPDGRQATQEKAEVELRASWSPGNGTDSGLVDDIVAHLAAWCDLLCTMAGLPPPGVRGLPSR